MNIPARCEVAIIGAGPSGLAAAAELARLGVSDVIVLEREPSAGGIPRHCGHPPFGFREFRRILKGPDYANRLVSSAIGQGVRILTGVSVIALHDGGGLTLSYDGGVRRLAADRVLICTGARETPRSARLVGGSRGAGIMTTGALQSMVYLEKQRPCERPVVVGTELVAFSALLTCRHAGIRPVAMVEGGHKLSAYAGSGLLPWTMGVPIYRNTDITDIQVDQRVSRVQLQNERGQRWVDCDAVIFTGRFTPEASLCRGSHLALDHRTGGPLVDQFGRCSDPAFHAAGNVLRPIETAGWCWQEGREAAALLKLALDDASTAPDPGSRIRIASDTIDYVMPGILASSGVLDRQPKLLQVRLNRPARGTLQLRLGNQLIASKRINSVPERRILLPLKDVPQNPGGDAYSLSLE